MITSNHIVILFFIMLIISIGIFKSRQVNNNTQYLLANRKTTLFPLVATLVMTEFNTATLIAFSAAGYYAHWWAISLPCVFLIGLLFYAFTVAKKWKLFNGISVAHYFSDRYGKDIGILVAVILFLAMSGFTATYIKALTLLFEPLFPEINNWLLSAILIISILAITWRGGLVSIIRTDIISFIIILLFFPLLFFYTWHFHSHLNLNNNPITLSQMQQVLPPKFVVSLIFLTMFSYILAPWYGQKIISAESPRVAKYAVIIAAVLIFILYSLGISITALLATKNIVISEPQLALPYAIRNALPFGWQGVGYAVLFLTAATTLSGLWSAMVTLLIGSDVTIDSANKLLRSMILTGTCALLSYLLANLFIDQILNKMILANIPVVALSFALLAGFYWKKVNKVGVYMSIIIGLFWGIGCYVYFGEKNIYTWYWAIYGIPMIFIFGILGSKLAIKYAHH